MLGLWEVGSGPQRMSLHMAFGVALKTSSPRQIVCAPPE